MIFKSFIIYKLMGFGASPACSQGLKIYSDITNEFFPQKYGIVLQLYNETG